MFASCLVWRFALIHEEIESIWTVSNHPSALSPPPQISILTFES